MNQKKFQTILRHCASYSPFPSSIFHLSLPCCWHGMYQVALLSFSFQMDSAKGRQQEEMDGQKVKVSRKSLPYPFLCASSLYFRQQLLSTNSSYGEVLPSMETIAPVRLQQTVDADNMVLSLCLLSPGRLTVSLYSQL